MFDGCKLEWGGGNDWGVGWKVSGVDVEAEVIFQCVFTFLKRSWKKLLNFEG